MQWKWFLKSLQKYLGSPCMSVCAKSLQSCPTFWDPMDRSLQACLSLRFFRQEYWNRLPFPSPGDLPNPGIKPASMAQPNWHINEPSQSLPGPLPSPLGWDLPEPCGAITTFSEHQGRASSGSSVRWAEEASSEKPHTQTDACSEMSAAAKFTYAEYTTWNAGLEEEQAGIKIAGRNINNLRYADDTTLWQKVKGN